MNETDKQSALAAIVTLQNFFVQHQAGRQLLTQVETIIQSEKTTDDKNPNIHTQQATNPNVPRKKRRGRPRKKDDTSG